MNTINTAIDNFIKEVASPQKTNSIRNQDDFENKLELLIKKYDLSEESTTAINGSLQFVDLRFPDSRFQFLLSVSLENFLINTEGSSTELAMDFLSNFGVREELFHLGWQRYWNKYHKMCLYRRDDYCNQPVLKRIFEDYGQCLCNG